MYYDPYVENSTGQSRYHFQGLPECHTFCILNVMLLLNCTLGP